MTELRKSMIECLQLRGWSERTQELYVRAGRQLAEHDHTSPDLLTEAARRPSCLSSKHVTQYSRSASTIALCGITCCCEYPLNRDWTTRRCVRAPREQKLPVVLRLEEVRTLLGRVRRLSDRVCLSTLSSCGLRLQEGTPLPVRDLDRARLMLHVRPGTGGPDRDVPLPHRTLALRRHSWGTQRHPVLGFPAPGRGHAGFSSATHPMPKRSLHEACRQALTHSGLHPQASVHTLRPSWATPLLEAGVHLRLLHAYRGHNSPPTTSV